MARKPVEKKAPATRKAKPVQAVNVAVKAADPGFRVRPKACKAKGREPPDRLAEEIDDILRSYEQSADEVRADGPLFLRQMMRKALEHGIEIGRKA